MKRIVITAFFVLIFGISVSAQEKTDVKDEAAAQMLLGRHQVSLQWISWDYFGVATVTKKGDLFQISGRILSISATEFKFRGEIITSVGHINDGLSCSRVGTSTFKITGTRRYWRLQQMDNPCDHVTDYVDIYFR
ncbi:MAG: hypothetical protein DMF63_02935 [Acidobacteria bacterium]|nr:MAG: hypothetical protein DMF63_02935 [Acidobacteriota bacterium]